MYAEIILAKATPGLDKIYHYSIPKDLQDKARVGSQVLAPFGSAKRVGYVVGFVETSDVKGIRDIAEVLSPYPLFSRDSVELAKWMAEYYNSFFITALKTVMPPGMVKIEKRALKTKRKKPLYPVIVDGKLQMTDKWERPAAQKFELTPEQRSALRSIATDIDIKKFSVSLLYGVTGSGKTEVYLRAADHVVSAGGGAIILVPEVGLTPQIVERFLEHFGDRLAVYHSEMKDKDRDTVWAQIAGGEKKVVLGTRSAIFTPVKNLELIVLDEEYENTYKQEQNPRYHAREVAFTLAKKLNASVVLGSASPSIETYYHAKSGDYKLLELPKRIDDRPLPPVVLVDMRDELKSGNYNVLSKKLKEELKATMLKKEQAILFINRRGYFSFVMCRTCGHTIQCPKCSSSLIYYMEAKELRCNHCNYTSAAPVICPECQSTQIKFFGAGTQKIEQEVARVVPSARILRLDRDTVTNKGSYEAIIRSFIDGSADILIGTQMVTKGLDIGSVTLVGVVAADIGLNLPDFRAAEHTFQLITQVAGRAGRHKLAGKVIVQTYNPEHYAIMFASKHDYGGFYEEEIKTREALGYPPFGSLINLIIQGENEKTVEQVSGDLARNLKKRLSGAEAFGPAKAPIEKLKGSFRYQVIIKGDNIDGMRKTVVETLKHIVKLNGVRISVDIDPYNML
jgi:primosomal protein N' (replication factor Y) (superfamily II helicase)